MTSMTNLESDSDDDMTIPDERDWKKQIEEIK